jgi:spore germination cell wall hydrolase CwlJ-like protein
MTDDDVRKALPDLWALALVIYGEARAEPIEGKVAVGSVVRNRVLAPQRFGSTYAAVCIQKAQFSCFWKFGGEANFQSVMTIARALVSDYAVSSTVPKGDGWTESCYVAEGIIGRQLRSRVGAATHYMTTTLFRSNPPKWARGLEPGYRVGNHVFFAGVQ